MEAADDVAEGFGTDVGSAFMVMFIILGCLCGLLIIGLGVVIVMFNQNKINVKWWKKG